MYVLMQGHCLVVGFPFSWWHFISTMRSTLRKTLGKKKHHRSTKVCGWNYQLFYGGQILIVSWTFLFLLKAPAVNGDDAQDKQQIPMAFQHWQNWQAQIYGQTWVRYMVKLKYVIKIVAYIWSKPNIWPNFIWSNSNTWANESYGHSAHI